MRAQTHPPHITRPRLVVCPECGGTGHDYEYPINPSARPHKVPCTVCDGQGAYEKPGVSGASRTPAGAPVSSRGRGASIYDATNERWLSRPSGNTPAAGVPADLGRSTTHSSATHSSAELSSPTALQKPSAIPPRAEGTLLEAVMDAVTVASGIVVFGGLAFFMMVIA